MGPGLHTLNDKTDEYRRATEVSYLGYVYGTMAALARMRKRDYWVGASTVATLLGNAVAPGLLDRYLARTGFAAQQTAQPRPDDQPANLWQPTDDEVDRGFHGIFDDRSKRRSPQRWAPEHHWALVTAGTAAAATVAAAIGRRAVKGVR